jgi:2-keto-4-pentenoate hydratase/2-oxohepta-3-ene-1,7-dioic acid hydratase in catechol pathway
MRIARVEHEGSERAAIVDPQADTVHLLPPATTTIELLTGERAEKHATEETKLDQVRLLAPVKPPTIRDFIVFEQHIEGVRKFGNPEATVPDVWYASPFCYFTNPHALSGPGDEIPVPPGCTALDLELEVAAVIGRAGTNLTPEQAREHIAGYTIFNDWSARDLQGAEMKLGLGPCKGKDFANTLGPWIVTADELEPLREDDRLDLALEARINGEPLGQDTLASMAWGFEELVSYASRGTWVQPGDVLGSGTCGYGCLLELWGRYGPDSHPPLAPGDVVELSVQGIGTLTNRVVAGVDPYPLSPARRDASRARRLS